MPKFYTGYGDSGTTAIGARIVSKTDDIIKAVGDIDELNAELGVTLNFLENAEIKKEIEEIQNNLFTIGAELAALMDRRFLPKGIISRSDIKILESRTDQLGESIKLKGFVIPGGPKGSAHLDRSRAVARRAERSIVAISKRHLLSKYVLIYMNRLSSYLFVAARHLNKSNKIQERSPKY